MLWGKNIGEKGIQLVNLIIIFTCLFPGLFATPVYIALFVVWFLCLIYLFKVSESKAVRCFYIAEMALILFILGRNLL